MIETIAIEEIEGLQNLCRFLCSYQIAVDKAIYEAIEVRQKEKTDKKLEKVDFFNFIINKFPTVEGIQETIDLKNIGKQKIDKTKITDGIDYMLEINLGSEQLHEIDKYNK